VINAQFEQDGPLVFEHACLLGCEGIVSKRKASRYRSGRSRDWVKSKNPAAPAVKREAEEDWGTAWRAACEARHSLSGSPRITRLLPFLLPN
jgi:hypothetical protein